MEGHDFAKLHQEAGRIAHGGSRPAGGTSSRRAEGCADYAGWPNLGSAQRLFSTEINKEG